MQQLLSYSDQENSRLGCLWLVITACWLLHGTSYSVTLIAKKFPKLLLALGYHFTFNNLEFTAVTAVFKSYFTYQEMTTTINFI